MIRLNFTDEEKINKDYVLDIADEGTFYVDWDSVRYEEPYWLYFTAVGDDGKKYEFEVELEDSLTEEGAKSYTAGELINSGWDNYVYREV